MLRSQARCLTAARRRIESGVLPPAGACHLANNNRRRHRTSALTAAF